MNIFVLLRHIISWNPLIASDEENMRWSSLRAIEWGIWPAFLSGPVVPPLMLYFKWWKILFIIAILTVLWSFVRYRYINKTLAEIGVFFVKLKWISCPYAAISFVLRHNYILAIISIAWPFLAASMSIFVGGTQIGKIQNMFMAELGYVRNDNGNLND